MKPSDRFWTFIRDASTVPEPVKVGVLIAVFIAVFIAILLLAGCATQPEAGDDEIALNPRQTAMCAEEGGCAVITRTAFERLQREAFAAGQGTCRRSL